MSDLTEFRYRNKPEPQVIIEQVGEDPQIVYEVDYEEMQEPGPEVFDRVGTAQVKLAVATSDLDGELGEKADEAVEAVNDLVAAMTDEFVDDRESHDWLDLYMGNLSILPGVEKEART